MTDIFIIQDLNLKKEKKIITSGVSSLKCDICKKELNGISITGKKIKGKTLFLCSSHYDTLPQQIKSVS